MRELTTCIDCVCEFWNGCRASVFERCPHCRIECRQFYKIMHHKQVVVEQIESRMRDFDEFPDYSFSTLGSCVECPSYARCLTIKMEA